MSKDKDKKPIGPIGQIGPIPSGNVKRKWRPEKIVIDDINVDGKMYNDIPQNWSLAKFASESSTLLPQTDTWIGSLRSDFDCYLDEIDNLLNKVLKAIDKGKIHILIITSGKYSYKADLLTTELLMKIENYRTTWNRRNIYVDEKCAIKVVPANLNSFSKMLVGAKFKGKRPDMVFFYKVENVNSEEFKEWYKRLQSCLADDADIDGYEEPEEMN